MKCSIRWRVGVMTRATVRVVALIIGVATLSVSNEIAAQVPEQDRQASGVALRPAVMGPSGGVSTGHPLTTAVALGILLKGGNAFDAGVASLLVGGVLEQDLYSLGGEALVLVYPRKEGRSRRSWDRVGPRAQSMSIGMCRGTRRWRAGDWIRRSYQAPCTRR